MNTIQSLGSSDHSIESSVESPSYQQEEEKLSVENEKIQRVVKVVVFNDLEDASKNVVWMSESDSENLHFTFVKINDSDETFLQYIQIANRVYQVAINSHMDLGCIGLSAQQCEEIDFETNNFRWEGSEAVTFSSCSFKESERVAIKEITFEISLMEELESEMERKFVRIDELRSLFQEALLGKFVVKNQKLLISTSKGYFVAKVKEIQLQQTPEHSKPQENKFSSPFSLIVENTQIEFKSSPDISITGERFFANEYQCHFLVSLADGEDGNELPIFPVVLDWEKLYHTIMNEIEGRSLAVGYTFIVIYDFSRQLRVTFDRVKRLETIPSKPADGMKKRYQPAYQFSQDTSLEIAAVNRDIAIRKGEPAVAKTLYFEVVGVDDGKSTRKLSDFSWISVEEIKAVIQKQNQVLVKGQRFYITLSTGNFLVRLKSVEMPDTFPNEHHQTWSQALSMDQTTEIEVKVGSVVKGSIAAKVLLVDTEALQDIRSVTFKVISDGDEDEDVVRSPFKKTKDKVDTVLDKELREVSVKWLKRPIVLNQPFSIKMKGDRKFTLIPTLISYEAWDQSKIKYGTLAKVTEKSKILFEAEDKNNLVIVKDESDAICKDPQRALEELGLGGVTEEFSKIIRLIALGRGPMKKELERRGIKPVKGLLLSGPPGTGKTTLARQVGTILGCPEERVTKLTGTEILNKWVGGSEKNIRELFKPAIEAFERLKEEAPLYIVVIDEIESILPERGSDTNNAWRSNIVSQFLGVLDGVKQIGNILVIGMTNLPDMLDAAVLRPGRFDLHIKFGFPDVKGRKQIFEIHTKVLKESGCLGSDVNFETLAQETENYSGADIAGVVQKMVSYAVERLSKLNLSAEEYLKASEGISTMEDFRKAIKEVDKKKPDESWKTLSMYR